MKSSFTRRQLLSLGTRLCAALAAGCGSGTSSPPGGGVDLTNLLVINLADFPQPPTLRSQKGTLATTLVARIGTNQFGTQVTQTPTYNGQIPGPTLRLSPGETLAIELHNQLPPSTVAAPEPINLPPQDPSVTNLHTHGLHVSPKEPADNVLLQVRTGQSRSYRYNLPANHPPGTYWYHPHNHGSAAVQLFGGMAGALIIEGDTDHLPEIAAAREIVMVHSQLSVNSQGVVPPFQAPDFFGTTTAIPLINGKQNPTLEMLPGEVVRIRFVQAGVDSFTLLGLDGHVLHQIALDGITFARPVERSSILLATANRTDFLIRAGAPGSYKLQSLSHDQGFGPTIPFTLATVRVIDAPPVQMDMPTSLPAPFRDISADEVRGRRSLTFEVFPRVQGQPQYGISGQQFNPDRIDQTIELGAVEEWTLYNTTTEMHPFHIHVNPFQVVQINGQSVDPVWQDTAIIPPASGSTPGSLTFRTRFLDFDGLYVLHCHILLHECVGMMQTVNVVPRGLSRKEQLRRHRQNEARLARWWKEGDEFCGPLPTPKARLRWGNPPG